MKINSYINKIQNWFSALNSREQKLVMIAGIMISGILLSYSLQNVKYLFNPAVGKQALAIRADYDVLVPEIIQLKNLKRIKHNYSNLSLDELHDTILSNRPSLTALDKEEANIVKTNKSIDIKFKAVSFDDLMLWLEKLHRQYGISVISVDIEQHADKKGYVSAIVIITN